MILTSTAVPICHKCKKPVSSFSMREVDFGRAREFTAECHGREEIVTLDDRTFLTMMDISLGYAFLGEEAHDPPVKALMGKNLERPIKIEPAT